MNFHTKPTTFVSQVTIKVENLEQSLAFYKGILGFEILNQSSHSANLTTDGKTTILSLEQPENVIQKQGRTTGLYHFAILLPNRSDLALIVQHLLQIGIRFGSSDHLVSEALYFDDPDGNGIEIYVDRAPSEWQWNNGTVNMTVDPLNFEDLMQTAVQWKKWTKMPEGTVMGHIHLHVSELKNTETFYVKGLGLDTVCRYGNQALFLSSGGYHHHIGVNTWNGVGAPKPPENSVGLYSFTLNYPTEEARDSAIKNLKQLGYNTENIQNQLITFDPSGNRIVLTV